MTRTSASERDVRAGGSYTQPWPEAGRTLHIAYVGGREQGRYETMQEAAEVVRAAFAGLPIIEIACP